MKDHLHQNEVGRGRGVPGVISVAEIYTLDEAKRRLGWTTSALRGAKRRGLQLLASGKRRYITGREILRFLHAESDLDADLDPDVLTN